MHGFDNVLVAGAAADIAFQQLANFAFAGLRVVLAQIDRTHHHAGGAKTALQAVALFESRLHRVHGAVFFGQPLDGGDLAAVSLRGQNIARLDGTPVHDDRAGAALGRITADVRASQQQPLSQHLHQQRVGRRLHLGRFTVYLELNLHSLGLLWAGGVFKSRSIAGAADGKPSCVASSIVKSRDALPA